MHRFASFSKSIALFTLLTVVMTWPQAATLASSAAAHHDVYFNLWRFGWAAHALVTSPARLFDGNIFYPEPGTLTFSDAMPVEALLAAPLLLSGAPPVLVHNVMLLAGIVLSAAGIVMLASMLTGRAPAGVTAGIVFAFAPYRFEHYMHMELQWTVWIPWAFWALHRALPGGAMPAAAPDRPPGEAGSRKYGALCGLFVALQFLSSIYYGVFLATLLSLTAVLLLLGRWRDGVKRGAIALATGAVLAAVIAAPYAIPYLRTKAHVGVRSESEVLTFSARPSSYTVATETNYLYGDRSAARGRAERRLFPGVLAMLLALAGLLLRPPRDEAIAYLLALVAAFEMSLGLYGYSFTWLFHHVPGFDSLRAPARLGIFVAFFLALLAAYGHAAIEAALPRSGRRVLMVGICGLLMLEYWVAPLRLVPYANTAPPLYAWLAQQPRGVVAEFPIPRVDRLPGNEPRYAYMSTFHWMPTVNGYSGNYPPSYLRRIEALRGMPDARAIAQLNGDGVRYVVIHASLYDSEHAHSLLAALAADPRFSDLGHFDDGQGDAVVFRLR